MNKLALVQLQDLHRRCLPFCAPSSFRRFLFTLGSYLVGAAPAAPPVRSSFPFLSAPVFAIDLSSPLSLALSNDLAFAAVS